jgi:hypothetical protein
MKLQMAYKQSQELTLDGEQAFEELYLRLARWTDEIFKSNSAHLVAADTERIEQCVVLLGFMGQLIDLSHNFLIASVVLSLHRFAIATLIRVLVERKPGALAGLPGVFIELSRIFSKIGARKKRSS